MLPACLLKFGFTHLQGEMDFTLRFCSKSAIIDSFKAIDILSILSVEESGEFFSKKSLILGSLNIHSFILNDLFP